MRKITQIISSGVLAIASIAMVGAVIVPASVGAASCTGAGCARTGANSVSTGGANTSDIGTAIKTVVNILLFIVGAVAVVMVVIGGIKYTTSSGDSNSITSAKNTILYAVIGVIVAVSAYAVVNFVIDRFV